MRNRKIRNHRTARRSSATAAGAAIVLGFAAASSAQQSPEFLPQATLVEVMNSMVMPFTQVVWDAVVYEETIRGPATEEGWQEARSAAIALAESANVLMIPGRPVAGPEKTAAEGELSPQEIAQLIEQNRGAWVAHSRALHEAAMQAIQAIDAKDAEKLSDVGGTLDAVCQGCHMQFWYPNQ